MSLLTALTERLFRLIPVLLGITLIVFLFMHLTPGDPIEMMLGEAGGVTQAEIQRLRHEYGLDQPLPVQFARFVTRALRGDLGLSFIHQRPVTQIIAEYLPATMELTAVSLVGGLLLALPLGVATAMRRRSAWDTGGTLLALLGISLPGFFFGILLILVFGMALEWLPVSGRIDYGVELHRISGFYLLDSLLTLNGRAFVSALQHLLLPALAMGAWTAALTMRMTRASMLEVLRQDYIVFARAKGLSEAAIAVRHALKNALIPVVSVVGLQMGALLGGNMVIEIVFSWPGLGRLCVEAIYARNYPLVQGIVLLYAITFVFINLVTDVLYTLLNPRVRLT
ncbi:MAG: ABC transporter permease [Planctomycetes bacterium]|nr:ABC transporter permease [Planctomycetota bacterium]